MNFPADIDELKTQLRALWQRLKSEQQSAGRAGLLLGAAGALVWLSVVLSLSNSIDTAETRLRSMQAEIGRLRGLVNDSSWSERFAQSQALRQRLEQRFWTAATPGLAEASFEAWLRDRYQRHGIDVQQVIIARTPLTAGASPSGALPGVERMTAKVISTFRPSGIINVAADITENDKIVLIERLVVRTGRNARMESDVTTFTRLGDLSSGLKLEP